MTDYWDQENEVEDEGVYEERDLNSSMAYVFVNGSTIEVEPGSNLKETVRSYARDAGLGKFRVFLNGSELRPSEAPDVIEAGSKVELRPFDTAGL